MYSTKNSKKLETIENGLIRGFGKYQINGEISQKGLVSCAREAECNKFGKEDIMQALNQRAVIYSDQETKPILIKKLLKSNRMALDPLRSPLPSSKAKFPSIETNPSMYFLSGRDFREDTELLTKLNEAFGEDENENFYLSKNDIENLLIHMTKKRVFRILQQTVGGKFTRDILSVFESTDIIDKFLEENEDNLGLIGSSLINDINFSKFSETQVDETGNKWNGPQVIKTIKHPESLGLMAMLVMKFVNKHQGLFKTKYLTVDHVGLEMNNTNGDRYRVAYDPINDKGFWVAIRGVSWADIPDKMKLNGTFMTDSRGLPLINQLNWSEHKFQVMKDRQDSIMQVRCYRKDLSAEKGEEDENCRTDRNGNILMRWAPYDPTLKVYISPMNTKRFYTPTGILSYQEIMALPLQKITQMLLAMKLLQENNNIKNIFEKHNLTTDKSKIAKPMYPVIDLYDQKATSLSEIPLRNKTILPTWFTTAENQWYKDAGLKTCAGRKSFRCHIDSEIPGLCSPDPAICYDPKVGAIYADDKILKAKEIRNKIRTKSHTADSPNFSAIVDTLGPGKERALNGREVKELLKHVKLDSRGQLVLTSQTKELDILQSAMPSARIKKFKEKATTA